MLARFCKQLPTASAMSVPLPRLLPVSDPSPGRPPSALPSPSNWEETTVGSRVNSKETWHPSKVLSSHHLHDTSHL